MAFFATIEDLPSAKAQWAPRHRGRPRPYPPRNRRPVPPPRKPRTIPRRQGRPHHCTDGHKRILVTAYGNRKAWTCAGPIPYAYRSLINTSDQIRGRKKPVRVPPAIQEDRKPTRRTTRGYLKGRYKYIVDENPWGN
jgi:hypothetical protein